jgi:CheY-like chemotaxis protein
MAPAYRVLVVDDEPVVCGGISRVLQRHGHTVEIALGGPAALERLKSQSYDVILADIMMPQMNGLDFLSRLEEQGVSARVVMITGLGTARSAIEAFRLGAFDYVTKPFTSDELLSVTNRAGSADAAKCGEIPPPPLPDLYRLGVHSWVRRVEGGIAVLGIQECFQRSAGRLVGIDLPNEGDDLGQGEICARVRAVGGGVYNVWCPLSGRVLEVNLELNRDPSLANTDPYGAGWFCRVLPDRFEEEARLLRSRPPLPSTPNR